ncbi:hypothetical protein BDW62DRAFT_199633 [Aspergillus aurantiobrunneus]
MKWLPFLSVIGIGSHASAAAVGYSVPFNTPTVSSPACIEGQVLPTVSDRNPYEYADQNLDQYPCYPDEYLDEYLSQHLNQCLDEYSTQYPNDNPELHPDQYPD